MSAQRIAIIGAGNSGMSGFKACREQGFDVVVFEKTDSVGGIWRYRDEELEGNASIWRKIYLNTSKEMTAFSDFPPPEDYPNFMHNALMAEYLNSYAEKIGFKEHLKCQHQVIKCEPNEDYETTGNWRLTVKNLKEDFIFEDVFNGVMVCVGHNNKPIYPSFKGQQLFKGSIIHSHAYKVPKDYEEKTVVVVGIGNSAVDITCDLLSAAKKVCKTLQKYCQLKPIADLFVDALWQLDRTEVRMEWTPNRHLSPKKMHEHWLSVTPTSNLFFDRQILP